MRFLVCNVNQWVVVSQSSQLWFAHEEVRIWPLSDRVLTGVVQDSQQKELLANKAPMMDFGLPRKEFDLRSFAEQFQRVSTLTRPTRVNERAKLAHYGRQVIR